MKTLFFLISIGVSCSALANDLQDLKRLYTKGEYQQTYDKVSVYLKKHPLDKEAQMLYFRSAYQLGRTDDAMAAYDRVLIIDPQSVSAHIQMANIHLKSKAYDLAELVLNEIDSQKLSTKQKQEIRNLKKRLKSNYQTNNKNQANRRPQKVVNIQLSLGLLYDSNVSGDIGEETHILPAYKLDYIGSKKKGKFAHFESITLLKRINTKKPAGGLLYLRAYNKNYLNHDSKNDSSYFAAGLSAYYKWGKFKVSVPISFNHVLVDYKRYLNNYAIGVDVKHSVSNSLVEVGYKHSGTRFSDNQKKNANNNNLYAGVKYKIFENVVQSIRLKYARSSELEDLRTDINYNNYGISSELNITVTKKLNTHIKFSFDKYYYRDYNKVFLNKREDSVYTLGLGLGYGLSNSSSLHADINYINKQSNQFVYRYDKFLIPITYHYRF